MNNTQSISTRTGVARTASKTTKIRLINLIKRITLLTTALTLGLTLTAQDIVNNSPVSGTGIQFTLSADKKTLTNNSDITSTGNHAVTVETPSAYITNNAGANIKSTIIGTDFSAIYANASASSLIIQNNGLLQGESRGVELLSGGTVTNSGTINTTA